MVGQAAVRRGCASALVSVINDVVVDESTRLVEFEGRGQVWQEACVRGRPDVKDQPTCAMSARKRLPPDVEATTASAKFVERCVVPTRVRRLASAVVVASSMWGRSIEKLSLRLIWLL